MALLWLASCLTIRAQKIQSKELVGSLWLRDNKLLHEGRLQSPVGGGVGEALGAAWVITPIANSPSCEIALN